MFVLSLMTIPNILGLVCAFVTGFFVRSYLIMSTAEDLTNVRFIPSYSLLTGSKGIVFDNDKTPSFNAEDWFNKLGCDTFGCFFGSNMQIITRDPELVYKLLVQTFKTNPNRVLGALSKYFRASLIEARDKEWQTTRRAIGSVLKASKLKTDNVENDIDANVAKMLASVDLKLAKFAADGQEPLIDVLSLNKDFVMESLLNVVFDTHGLIDFNKEANTIVQDMTTFVTVNYEFIVRACFLIPTLSIFVRPIAGFFNHGKFMNKLVDKLDIIIENQSNLMRSSAKHGSSAQSRQEVKSTTIHSLVQSYHNGELNVEQLKGNSFFLMMASYTTIVDLMSVFIWIIARDQERQNKLREELLLTGEKSQYLEQCINETLRLYPPASITNRELSQTMYHRDYVLPKGALLNVNIFSVHHDPKYWGPNVEEWLPERFDPDKAKLFHPGQFLPFGLGPRNCVGYHFAKLEVMKLASQLLIRYKFEACDKTQDALSILALGAFPFTLPIEGKVLLKVSHAMQS